MGKGMREKLGEIVDALKLKDRSPLPERLSVFGKNIHEAGTARMGNDPETSVVNRFGQSHDVKNLFVIDGSLFVTSGGVNPTATIQALALYIADTIKQKLDTLFD